MYFSSELDANMIDMYDEGDWGSYDTCPTGSYAAGIQLKGPVPLERIAVAITSDYEIPAFLGIRR